MIDLYKLHHFVVLVRSGSYVQAAQRLALSQPALSRSIQSLERRIGARLLYRSKAGLTLTAIGEAFYTQAEQLLLRAENLEDNVKLMLRGAKGEVRFGIAPAAASVFLRRLLPWVQEHYPDVRVHVTIAALDEMRAQLIERKLDFFVARERADIASDQRIAVSTLGTTAPMFFVRHDHPLLALPAITIEELSGYPIASGTAWNEYLRQMGTRDLQKLAAAIELDNYELLAELAATSDIILVASYGEVHPSLRPLPLAATDLGIPRTTVSIYALDGLEQSPISRVIQKTLKKHFTELQRTFP